MNFTRTFTDSGDFKAMRSAESFLKERGFSVGRSQRDFPRGLMFGDFDIPKWRNIDDEEIRELHGRMTGEMRKGPVTIIIFQEAPPEAIAAVALAKNDRIQEVQIARIA